MTADAKLQQVATIFLDGEFTLLDRAEASISGKRLELLNAFVDVYGKEFIDEKKGQFCYCHDKLVQLIHDQQSYRKAIARLAQGDAAPAAAAPDANSCTVS